LAHSTEAAADDIEAVENLLIFGKSSETSEWGSQIKGMLDQGKIFSVTFVQYVDVIP